MSRSICKETSSLVSGIVGRFGGSSTGFVVAALNAASAASREVVVLRVLSAGILCLALMLPAPRQKPPQISPIFISDKVTLHVSREKDGKLRLGYAGMGRIPLGGR